MVAERGAYSPKQAAHLLPGQLAVMEAARAIWGLVGEEHIENFAVVGGVALLFHGGNVWTHDIDVAINAQSLNAFIEAAKGDERFTCTAEVWEYRSSEGIMVEIEFLDKDGTGGYLPRVRGYSLIDGVPVATLADLALGKGVAWVDRCEAKDLNGLEFAIERMVDNGMDFRGIGIEERDLLAEIVDELGQGARGRELARVIRTLL